MCMYPKKQCLCLVTNPKKRNHNLNPLYIGDIAVKTNECIHYIHFHFYWQICLPIANSNKNHTKIMPAPTGTGILNHTDQGLAGCFSMHYTCGTTLNRLLK